MTTEKHNLPDAYFNVQQPDVGTIRVSRHDSERYGLEVIVYFGDDVNMHVRTVAKARELLAAAFEALRILDPDGTVTVRTENEEIHTLAEILPTAGRPRSRPAPSPALAGRPWRRPGRRQHARARAVHLAAREG